MKREGAGLHLLPPGSGCSRLLPAVVFLAGLLPTASLEAQGAVQLVPADLFLVEARRDPSRESSTARAGALRRESPSSPAPRTSREASPETGSSRPAGKERSPRLLPGVSIDRLDSYDGDFQAETRRVPLQDLNLLELKISYDVPPAFVDREPYTPVLDFQPPQDSPQLRGAKNLIHREFFRQLRKRVKRQWRNTLVNQYDLRYEEYESNAILINQLGREPAFGQSSSADYYSRQVRGDVFRRDEDVEDDLPVLQLGPVVLLDSGSIHVDMRTLTDLVTGEQSEYRPPVEVAPDVEKVRQPLFSGSTYKLKTSLRVDFNPFRVVQNGDPFAMARSVSGTVEVTWLTDILRREMFRTEVEAQYHHDDGLSLFFNVVLNSR